MLGRRVGLVLLLEGFDVLGHAERLFRQRLVRGDLGDGLFGGLRGVGTEEGGGQAEGQEETHGGEGCP